MDKQSTQSFIPVKEIRDGMIVRDDGSISGVVIVTAMNFDLKSADEQQAILYQFQNLLNSLEMSTQFIIQSRRVNLKPYLAFLKDIYEKQNVELLRLQTKEYINFINDFLATHDIMTKKFFCIINYTPISVKKGVSEIFNFNKKNTKQEVEEGFEEDRNQLLQRINFLQSNIRALGLKAVLLETEEVIELLYQTFNPGDSQTPVAVSEE